MEKRYQVFVSSTYADLKDERQAVIQTLMEMDCIPAGMELFPSIDEEQLNFIKKVIDDCDYYIIIIGGRYGSVTNEGISFTEKEYDYAVKKGLKIIAFIHGEPENIPVGKSEKDFEKIEKLKNFITKVSTGRLVKPWTEVKDLPGLVSLSLNKTIKQYPATGWIRGNENQYDSSALLLEINDLRKENIKLKEDQRIQESKIEIPDLAEMNDTYIFNGFYRQKNASRKVPFELKVSWNELFAVITPYILSNPDDETVENTLKGFCAEKIQKNNVGIILLSKDIINTIKIQFIANGFISPEGYSWDLTEKGRMKMLMLRAVRKKG